MKTEPLPKLPESDSWSVIDDLLKDRIWDLLNKPRGKNFSKEDQERAVQELREARNWLWEANNRLEQLSMPPGSWQPIEKHYEHVDIDGTRILARMPMLTGIWGIALYGKEENGKSEELRAFFPGNIRLCHYVPESDAEQT